MQPLQPLGEKVSTTHRLNVLQLDELTSPRTLRSQLPRTRGFKPLQPQVRAVRLCVYALTASSKLHDQDVKSGILIHDKAGDFLMFHCGHPGHPPILGTPHPGHPRPPRSGRSIQDPSGWGGLACAASTCHPPLILKGGGMGKDPCCPDVLEGPRTHRRRCSGMGLNLIMSERAL